MIKFKKEENIKQKKGTQKEINDFKYIIKNNEEQFIIKSEDTVEYKI